MAIKYYGVYRFQNVKYPTLPSKEKSLVLKAYGSTSLGMTSGRNVMLYEKDTSDQAQQWRVMYAGKNGGTTLYWLNCMLGAVGEYPPYALDCYFGTLKYNADVYSSQYPTSAADQLIYFSENSSGQVRIRLYDNGYALTAASAANGTNSPSSLTSAGNCYWKAYSSSDTAQLWTVETVTNGYNIETDELATVFPANYFYNNNHNGSYPDYVGECTWYCKGRFYEVNDTKILFDGNAATWATDTKLNGLHRINGDKNTLINQLQAKSIAVFAKKNDSKNAGHVAFIEEVYDSSVVFSEVNGTTLFDLSNGQIEVPCAGLPKATDGLKQRISKSNFVVLYNYEITAIIYK